MIKRCILCEVVLDYENSIWGYTIDGERCELCLDCAYKVKRESHPHIKLNKFSHEIVLYYNGVIIAITRGNDLYGLFRAECMNWGHSGSGGSLYYSVDELAEIIQGLLKLPSPPLAFINQLKRSNEKKVRVRFC